jgi:hypothetical protein
MLQRRKNTRTSIRVGLRDGVRKEEKREMETSSSKDRSKRRVSATHTGLQEDLRTVLSTSEPRRMSVKHHHITIDSDLPMKCRNKDDSKRSVLTGDAMHQIRIELVVRCCRGQCCCLRPQCVAPIGSRRSIVVDSSRRNQSSETMLF